MSRPSKRQRAARQLVQAHEAAAERRLAAARLADEAERLARAHLDVDAVDGLHLRDRALRAARRDREVLAQRRSPRSSGSPLIALTRLRPGSPPCAARRSLGSQAAAVEMRRTRCVAASSGALAGSASCRRRRQRGANAQPAGQVDQRRRQAGDRGQPRAASRRSSRGIEPSRPQVYGCCGSSNSSRRRALLDDPSRVHHGHVVGRPRRPRRGRA